MVYTTNDAVRVYVDNAVIAEHDEPQPAGGPALTNGKIVIGRLFTTSVDDSRFDGYGKLTVDHLTIWDRPLSEEERNLIHQD